MKAINLPPEEDRSDHLQERLESLPQPAWNDLPIAKTEIQFNKSVIKCYSLAAAGNKSATRPPLPLLGCGGEWKKTGRNWWVGIRAV